MAAACGSPGGEAEPEAADEAPAAEAPAAETGPPSKYNESPLLAERVAAGQLPPVDERLPANPVVIEPLEEIGQYGGTTRVAIGNPNHLFGDPQAVMGTELILRIDSDFSSITSGLADSWEFNDDATEQILYLREGLMWSDGAPFSADDFIFAWHDLQMNEEYRPGGPPSSWKAGASPTGDPLEMEKTDDYTIKPSFSKPYPLIVLHETFYAGSQGGLWQPAHYLKQFHPDYGDADEIAKMTEDAGFEEWRQLPSDKGWVGSDDPAVDGAGGGAAG